MTDAMTQLAKEYLETHGYIVSTNVKANKKGRKTKRTESDIDIIAHRHRKPDEPLPWDDTLDDCKYVIAEVKTYSIKRKKDIKDLIKDKFNAWDKKRIKKYVPLANYKRILFCKNVTPEVLKVAKTNILE